MLLLVQTNVSARVDHEVRMTLMNEAQMGMLEQVGTECEDKLCEYGVVPGWNGHAHPLARCFFIAA